MFDARSDFDQTEELKYNNTLKKVSMAGAVRNMTREYEEIKQIVLWPQHKKIPHKVKNMHTSEK